MQAKLCLFVSWQQHFRNFNQVKKFFPLTTFPFFSTSGYICADIQQLSPSVLRVKLGKFLLEGEIFFFFTYFIFRHADPHSGICLWCLAIQRPIVPFSHLRFVLCPSDNPLSNQRSEENPIWLWLKYFSFCRRGVSFWWSFKRGAYQGIVSCWRGLFWTCQNSCTSGT